MVVCLTMLLEWLMDDEVGDLEGVNVPEFVWRKWRKLQWLLGWCFCGGFQWFAFGAGVAQSVWCTGYGMGDQGIESWHRQEICFLQENVLRLPSSIIFNRYRVSSPLRIKRRGHEFYQSLPSITEVKNEWICTFILPIRLHSLHMNDTTFPYSSCVWNCLTCGCCLNA